MIEMGSFLHACEGEIVCESINTKIPYFNAPIYLENKVSNPSLDHAVNAQQCITMLTDDRPPLARSTRSWDPSTKFTLPSSLPKASKPPHLNPATSSTLEVTSFSHLRSSFQNQNRRQERQSPSVQVVLDGDAVHP